MSDSKVTKYPGKRAEVSWHGGLCIHIGECGRAKGELFVGKRKPWCDPDLASDDEVEDVIKRCPSGALAYTFADGSATETASTENTISVAYNGPLFVRGALEIEGAPSDAPGLSFRAALCRCGQSKNKPFCDNAHARAGFKDSGAVGLTGAPDGESGGPLSIRPSQNGPFLLKGNFTIVSSSGRRAWSGKQAALCRCGGSGNKPFCDGSHKRNGFVSE